MTHRTKSRLSWLAVVLFAAACAKPPTQEMSEADSAVNAAVQAGAELYASEELALAQEVLADAKAKLESKDFKGAKMSALEAKAKAEAAEAAVEPNKQAAMASARERMDALKPQLETAGAAAQKVKGRDAAAAKSLAADLAARWTAIESEFGGGNYNTAVTLLDEAESKLVELNQTLEAAASAPVKRK
jgi:hypothetical protein